MVEHHARLRRYLLAVFGPGQAHDAEEVLQETWLRALRGFARGDDVERLTPWLVTLARRAAIDRLRRSSGLPLAPLDDAEPAAEEPAEPWPQGLARALTCLGAGERELIVLHHLEGASVQDVAQVLGVPEGTVKSRLHRVRRSLRAQLTRGS